MNNRVERCAICGGVIHRRWTLGPPENQPWLHLLQEDWINSPHDAVPKEPAREGN